MQYCKHAFDIKKSNYIGDGGFPQITECKCRLKPIPCPLPKESENCPILKKHGNRSSL